MTDKPGCQCSICEEDFKNRKLLYRHCQCGHAMSSHAVACGHQDCPCLRYSRCECREPEWPGWVAND